MRDPIIRKHYRKSREKVGWTAAVFHVCNKYGLDQYVVYRACGFDMRHVSIDTYAMLRAKQAQPTSGATAREGRSDAETYVET